mgnify:FL=1
MTIILDLSSNPIKTSDRRTQSQGKFTVAQGFRAFSLKTSARLHAQPSAKAQVWLIALNSRLSTIAILNQIPATFILVRYGLRLTHPTSTKDLAINYQLSTINYLTSPGRNKPADRNS